MSKASLLQLTSQDYTRLNPKPYSRARSTEAYDILSFPGSVSRTAMVTVACKRNAAGSVEHCT